MPILPFGCFPTILPAMRASIQCGSGQSIILFFPSECELQSAQNKACLTLIPAVVPFMKKRSLSEDF